jgi:nucleoid-associated protein YgaU
MDMGKYVAVGVLAVIVLAAVTYEPPKDGTTATQQPQDGARVNGVFGDGGGPPQESPSVAPVPSHAIAATATSTVPATVTPTTQATSLPASAPREEGQRYTIKSGETLCDVAQALLGDRGRWREVYEQNKDKLPDPDHVRAGITLVVKAVQRSTTTTVTTTPTVRDTSGQCPTGGRSYTVVRGDTGYSIARRELGNGNRWREIKSLNRLETDTVIVGSTLLLPPR